MQKIYDMLPPKKAKKMYKIKLKPLDKSKIRKIKN